MFDPLVRVEEKPEVRISSGKVAVQVIESPLGALLAAAAAEGLLYLEFVEEGEFDRSKAELTKRFGELDVGGVSDYLALLRLELAEYFARARRSFSVALAPRGTVFQLLVWRSLLEIPYGKTISYSALAQRIGRPNAVRAVARANGANPISILIPCHRVIGANGSLTGYGGGLWRKQQLLELESRYNSSYQHVP